MIHYPDHQQTRKNKAHEIEINLNCPQCHSKTYPCLINEKEMMLTCQNNKVNLFFNLMIFSVSSL